MYIWNMASLSKQLGKELISEKLGMYYFVVSSLLILFATYYALWWGVIRDWLFYFELIVLSIITVFGCIKAFESNGGDDGKAFVLRVTCLSVPAGMRVSVFSVIFGLVMYFTSGQIFTATSFGDPVRAYIIISYAGFIGFNIYFWWLVIRGFKEIQLNYKKN